LFVNVGKGEVILTATPVLNKHHLWISMLATSNRLTSEELTRREMRRIILVAVFVGDGDMEGATGGTVIDQEEEVTKGAVVDGNNLFLGHNLTLHSRTCIFSGYDFYSESGLPKRRSLFSYLAH
jgi:putative intracellular protease/amidase